MSKLQFSSQCLYNTFQNHQDFPRGSKLSKRSSVMMDPGSFSRHSYMWKDHPVFLIFLSQRFFFSTICSVISRSWVSLSWSKCEIINYEEESLFFLPSSEKTALIYRSQEKKGPIYQEREPRLIWRHLLIHPPSPKMSFLRPSNNFVTLPSNQHKCKVPWTA